MNIMPSRGGTNARERHPLAIGATRADVLTKSFSPSRQAPRCSRCDRRAVGAATALLAGLNGVGCDHRCLAVRCSAVLSAVVGLLSGIYPR
jgi:hypothetical protein